MTADVDPLDNVAPLRRKGEPPGWRSPRADDLLAKLVPASDFTPRLERAYVVKGWLNAGAMSVVYGESSVGKTFLALDLAAHVAAGREWNGCRVRQGAVLYIAAEGGQSFGNRVAAIEGRDGLPLWVLPTTVDLCKTDGDTGALIRLVRHLSEIHGGYALIVLDTLARSMGSGDENASPDMGAFVRNVDRLRAMTGAHVLIVHHTGKDRAKGARGHSSLRAATDTEIELAKEGETIVAEARKQRDMAAGRRFAYRLREIELGQDQDGDPVTTCVVEPTETPEKAVNAAPKGKAKVALQALDDALATAGQVRTNPGMWPGGKCVRETEWADMCKRHSLSGSDDPQSQSREFRRQREKLRDQGFVTLMDGYVWRARK